MRIRPAVLLVLAGLLGAGVSHARLRFGVEGGARYADAAGDQLGNEQARTGWSLGLLSEAPIASRWSIVAGARYLEHHDDYEFGEGVFAPGSEPYEVRTDLSYLTVPLRVEFRPAGGLVLEAGGDVGYLLDATSDVDLGTAAFGRSPIRFARIFEELGTLGADDLYEDWNIAFAAGAGWDFPWTDRVLTLRLRYEQGLTNLHPSDEVERHSRAIALDAGVRW